MAFCVILCMHIFTIPADNRLLVGLDKISIFAKLENYALYNFVRAGNNQAGARAFCAAEGLKCL